MTKAEADVRVILRVRAFDAAIFDMDGVVTQTATVHATAWKRMFDEYLATRAERGDGSFEPFDIDGDGCGGARPRGSRREAMSTMVHDDRSPLRG
jgi:beta-phosphoglucomutase-like phosphatase (HAD superfamily)